MMYPVTSKFMANESFRDHGHLGMDFAMPDHTPLLSIQKGIVENVVHYKDNIGNGVFVRWEDGKTAIYGHMSEITVSKGDTVDIGSLIGYSGNSGHVVGANGGYHLHFAVKDHGHFIDPAPWADSIQNMQHLKMLAAHHTDIVVQHAYTFADLFKGQMHVYQDLFQSFKLNCIHFVTSIDYSMFVHHLQYLLQLFLG